MRKKIAQANDLEAIKGGLNLKLKQAGISNAAKPICFLALDLENYFPFNLHIIKDTKILRSFGIFLLNSKTNPAVLFNSKILKGLPRIYLNIIFIL